MLDPLIVHELIYGEPDFPDGMDSDVAKLSWYARENDVSMEDLRIELEKFKDRYAHSTSWKITIWADTAQKAIKQERSLVGNLKVLDTKLTSSGGHEYAATINLKKDKYTPEGRYVVNIVQKYTDNENGQMTGIPNAEYWSGVPSGWYATSLLGWDGSERIGDKLMIDGGQNWYVEGVRDLMDEIEAKYGDKIKAHDMPDVEERQRKTTERLNQMTSESIRAKKVYEAMGDILKPKSEEEIERDFEVLIDDLAELAVEDNEYSGDFYHFREIFSKHKDRISRLVSYEYSMEDIVRALMYGWETQEYWKP